MPRFERDPRERELLLEPVIQDTIRASITEENLGPHFGGPTTKRDERGDVFGPCLRTE